MPLGLLYAYLSLHFPSDIPLKQESILLDIQKEGSNGTHIPCLKESIRHIVPPGWRNSPLVAGLAHYKIIIKQREILLGSKIKL